jgi:hypothetical protein
VSEFTDCLKDALAVAHSQFGTTVTFGATAVTGILSTVTQRENLELHGVDLDLSATFTADKTVLTAPPEIGTTALVNSTTYRVISLDDNTACFVLGLREA